MNKTIHFFVSGRVQGVFFRAETRRRADQDGITGWVRNLRDGRVEGTASGDETRLELFKAWLKQGPAYARVDDVFVEEVEYQEFDEFRVR